MIRRPPRSTLDRSSAASDVYKRQSIQYAISDRQFVTLKVYDVLGKEIATLVNEEKSAGSYEIDFNASHLVSGIYYYQLRAGDCVETKKMILLK